MVCYFTQIKDRDDTISWTLRQNEMQQHQASELKKKVSYFLFHSVVREPVTEVQSFM